MSRDSQRRSRRKCSADIRGGSRGRLRSYVGTFNVVYPDPGYFTEAPLALPGQRTGLISPETAACESGRRYQGPCSGLNNIRRHPFCQTAITRECTIDQKGKLCGKPLFAFHSESCHEGQQPIVHLRFVSPSDASRGMFGIRELRGRIDLRTSAVPIARYASTDPVEKGHECSERIVGVGLHDCVPLTPKLCVLAFEE